MFNYEVNAFFYINVYDASSLRKGCSELYHYQSSWLLSKNFVCLKLLSSKGDENIIQSALIKGQGGIYVEQIYRRKKNAWSGRRLETRFYKYGRKI